MNITKLLLLCTAAMMPLAFADGSNQVLELDNTATSSENIVTPAVEDSHGETLVAGTSVMQQQESQDFASAWGVSVQVGTLGIGLNISHALYSDYLDIRGQYNYLSYNTTDQNNLFKLNFNTLGLLLDYKPFGGSFRFTGGFYYDDRSFNTSGDDVDVGNGYYGSGSTGFKYPMISPYLGIGIGSQAASSVAKKGFLVNFDAGLMFAKPSTYSNLTCNSNQSQTCDGFNAQVQSYLDNLNSGFVAFPYYPVLSLSLGYRF